MPGTNFRFPYGFDQAGSDAQPGGGLLGLIQQVMQQQGLQQQVAPRSSANLASSGSPDRNAPPSGGVLGPLLAMQAGQYPAQFGGNGGPTPAPWQGPNFKQPTRAPIGLPSQAAAGPSDRSSDPSNGSYTRFGNSGSFELGPGQSTPLSSVRSNTAAPSATGTAAQVVPVQWGGGVLPAPLPLPPFGPTSPDGSPTIPSIPRPAIPDAWRKAWAIFQLFPRIASGLGGGGGGDREGCYERESTETAKCWARKEDYAHPDYLHGCIQRAKHRRDLCVKNGGKPAPSEPPEWGPADEETWRNYGR